MSEVIPDAPLSPPPPGVDGEDLVSSLQPNILSGLRAKRDRLGAGSEPDYFDVPGYDEQLVLKFVWVPLKELSRTGVQLIKIKEPTEQTISAAADAIAATCAEILVRVDKTIKPLSMNGVPVTFSDPRVGVALGFTATDARSSVVRTFNNEYALIKIANAVTEWLEDASKSVNERYLGE